MSNLLSNRPSLWRALLRPSFGIVVALWSGTMMAATVNTNKCEEDWNQVMDDKRFPDIQSKVKQWESLTPKCAGSGLYESRLGNLYTQGKQFDKARASIEQGLSYKTKYDGELWVEMGNIYLLTNDISAAEKQFTLVVQKYPDWFLGYQGLGTADLMRHRFREAIKWLGEATKRQQHAFTYRELTIAHHHLGQHEQAVKALDIAFGLDQNLIVKDRDAMLAGAVSYTKVGKYKVANGIVGMLLEARPDLRNDTEIIRVQKFVTKKLKEIESGATK